MKEPHRIAGRLRLKFSRLRNDPALARLAECNLRRLDGICLVQTNIHTGTLLVHHTASRAREPALLAAIAAATQVLGPMSGTPLRSPFPPAPRSTAHGTDRSRQVASFLVSVALDKYLDRASLGMLRLFL
jgi:hypothetical protein